MSQSPEQSSKSETSGRAEPERLAPDSLKDRSEESSSDGKPPPSTPTHRLKAFPGHFKLTLVANNAAPPPSGPPTKDDAATDDDRPAKFTPEWSAAFRRDYDALVAQGAAIVEFAVLYGRYGFRVHPCNPASRENRTSKNPLLPPDRDADGKKIDKTGGVYKATTDETQIRRWWEKWPDALIGLATDDLLVIDPDTPDVPGEADGVAYWNDLVERHGRPATHMHRTTSDGLHVCFRLDPNRPRIGNTVGQFHGNGVHVRSGSGSYVIAPPSTMRDGKSYRVEGTPFAFAAAPEWVYAHLKNRADPPRTEPNAGGRGRPKKSDLDRLAEGVAATPRKNPGRNNALYAAAFRCGLRGYDEEESRARLYEACHANGLMSDAEDGPESVEKTFDSGFKAGRANLAENDDKAAAIEREYPLPVTVRDLHYEVAPNGAVMVYGIVKSYKDSDHVGPISSPWTAPARVKYIDRHGVYGVRIALMDAAGKRREIDVPRGKLDSPEFKDRLLDEGMVVENDGDEIVAKILKGFHPESEISVFRAAGLHEVDGKPVFICPNGFVVTRGDPLPPVELALDARIPDATACGGTYEGWRETVVKPLVAVHKNAPHFALGPIIGLAGVTTMFSGERSCGVSFLGGTGSGKTTLELIAAGCTCKPDPKAEGGLFHSARATDNAVESLAATANGATLILDDLVNMDGKKIGAVVFMITGETGKGRSEPTGLGLRRTQTWTCYAVLSSEIPIQAMIERDGGKWTRGLARRIPEIDVDDTTKFDASVAAALNAAIETHYGHAYPDFVTKLMKSDLSRADVSAMIRDRQNDLAGREVGPTRQTALSLAILWVTGDLAVRFGVLPEDYPVAYCVRWAWERVKGANATTLDPKEVAFEHLKGWVLARRGQSIRSVDTPDDLRTVKAEGHYDIDKNKLYILKDHMPAACGGQLGIDEIHDMLKERNLIVQTSGERHYTYDYVPKVGTATVYVLRLSEFFGSEF